MTENLKQENKIWRPLEKIFNEVPHRYDLMNRLLTFRFDVLWRKMAARECLAVNPVRILDLCTGTGDLAIQIAQLANNKAEILGLDYSDAMLSLAQKKASKKGLDQIRFIRGDAADLPFENKSMDAIGIAFAFRNLTYKNPDHKKFLKEIYRVLSDKGNFVIVETSQPTSKVMRFMFHTYLKIVVGGTGGILSGHQKAYHYLASSARNFYTPVQVSNMLAETGFSQIRFKKLLGGIAGIAVAIK